MIEINSIQNSSPYQIYKELYGNEDGSIPATFHVFNFIGWKPDPSQSKPARRGSATHSLKDIGELDKLVNDKGDKPKS